MTRPTTDCVLVIGASQPLYLMHGETRGVCPCGKRRAVHRETGYLPLHVISAAAWLCDVCGEGGDADAWRRHLRACNVRAFRNLVAAAVRGRRDEMLTNWRRYPTARLA